MIFRLSKARAILKERRQKGVKGILRRTSQN